MTTRRIFVCGNWKLHKTVAESVELARAVRKAAETVRDVPVDVGIAPVFVSLHPVAQALAGGSVALAAQNGYWEPEGAFTGEISFPLIRDVGCTHVILGHSERRHVFGETEEEIARKVRAALDADLKVIFCIGEMLDERERGEAQTVVRRQVTSGLEGLTAAQMGRVVLAYEPVWAIGTGKTATTDQAQEMHAFIRSILKESFGRDLAGQVVIQYGGSVKPSNAAELLSQPDVDGALVGGAALKADSFAAIIEAAVNVARN